MTETQTTLAQEAFLSGSGVFTGEKVSLKLCPAPESSGIQFQRMDLPGKPLIPAHLSFVREAPRCTRLGSEKGSVYLVEHLLSALYALGVDNVRIEMEGSEVPIGDGSARPFVELIRRAGLQKQNAPRRYLRVEKPVFWTEGDTHLVALPSSEFRISYTLHYPQSSYIRSQYFSSFIDAEIYQAQIAPCRTFSLYEEILPLIEKGVIKGGGLDNAVVVQGDRILNPEGTRFPDEMVGHKVLDLIGDLALLGMPLIAHVLAIRSGHASNVAFAKTILYQVAAPSLHLGEKGCCSSEGSRWSGKGEMALRIKGEK